MDKKVFVVFARFSKGYFSYVTYILMIKSNIKKKAFAS